MLRGIVQSAPPNVRGFDTDSVITAGRAALLVQAGYNFAARYLSLSSPQRTGDLSAGEAQVILASGLALFPVQHVPNLGWAPLEALGIARGLAAASNATQVGFPPGVCVALDLEGVSSDSAPADVIAYCNAWCAQVEAAGFLPMLYVGAQCGLSGSDLYHRLSVERYWKSGSDVPELAGRGWCLRQTIVPKPVAGVSIDEDETVVDDKGGTLVWLAPVS